MNTDERDSRNVRAEDEIDETLDAGPEEAAPEHAPQQDFAARTAMMSNALPGGAGPAAGAIIGSGGELGMDPTTDDSTRVALEKAEAARPDHDGSTA